MIVVMYTGSDDRYRERIDIQLVKTSSKIEYKKMRIQ